MSWSKSPRHIPLTSVRVEKTDANLMSRSVYWEVYSAVYGSTCVAALCYRHSSRCEALWAATVYYLDEMLDTLHPNLVQVIGLVYDMTRDHLPSTNTLPQWLLLEKCPTSLFELLHVQRLPLQDTEIVQIAIEIVKVISFCDGHGLRNLTSRKILLESTSRVKVLGLLQRDILEMANAPIITTAYLPPPYTSAQNTDIYSFGVLLWEMCCREKPTVELFTRIAQVRVARPDLHFAENMVRACTHEDPLLRPSSQELIEELTLALQNLRKCSYPSQLSAPLQLPTTPGDIVAIQTIKRLEAVESQVLEEQRNFDIVVGQLEFATTEIESLQNVLSCKCQEFDALKGKHAQALETIENLRSEVFELKQLIETYNERTRELEKEKHHLEYQYQQQKEQANKVRLDHEAANHQVYVLREDLKVVADQLQKANKRIEEEKEISDELSVRWQQTIKLCQQEQLLREKGEQHVTSLRNENRDLRDQLHNWHPESGVLALERQKKMVQEINDHVAYQNKLQHELSMLKDDIQSKDMKICSMETQNEALQADVQGMKCQLLQLQKSNESMGEIIQTSDKRQQQLQDELSNKNKTIEELNQELALAQDKLAIEVKQRHDEELARKARRCLDLSCDAPPFLIQPSGYCKDHHEKREREKAEKQRLLDEATRQKPPEQFVAEVFDNGGLAKVLSLLQTFHESPKIISAAIKKLQSLCEALVEHKNQLGDLNGFKILVDISSTYKAQDLVQLQLVRLFGVAAFNHDINRVRLVSEGALDAIVAAMSSFPDILPLQQSSCTALTNLAHCCEGNRRKILEKGGLERVLDAMQRFPREVSLQECACWSLISLAGSDFTCEHIAGRGGLGAILAGMLNCPGESSVQYYGLWALLNLVTGVDSLQQFAIQEEVCEAAMACHSDHAGIQDKAQCLLDMLSDNQEEYEEGSVKSSSTTS